MIIKMRGVQTAVVFLAIAALLLAGCANSVGSFGLETTVVESAEVTRSMNFVQGLNEGPLYEVKLTLPEDWVGNFVSQAATNVLQFEFVDEEGQRFPIFSIEALSAEQFWQQQGSYPGQHGSLRNTPDTYFIYHLPIDAYHSGLPSADFEALAEQVPDIMTTFEIVN